MILTLGVIGIIVSNLLIIPRRCHRRSDEVRPPSFLTGHPGDRTRAEPSLSPGVAQTNQVRISCLKWGFMFAEEIERPFDSIESAHDYMDILATTTLEALSELKRDRDRALRDGDQRRAQAIDLAIFKLKSLNCYVYKSRRMLNDLRILRRLILNERLSVESIIATM
jgi:hypothetical protein